MTTTETLFGIPFYSPQNGYNNALQVFFPTPQPEAVPQAAPRQDSSRRQAWCMLMRAIKCLLFIILFIILCMVAMRQMRQMRQTQIMEAKLEHWEFCNRFHAQLMSAKSDYFSRVSDDYFELVGDLEDTLRFQCIDYHNVWCLEINEEYGRCLPPNQEWGWDPKPNRTSCGQQDSHESMSTALQVYAN